MGRKKKEFNKDGVFQIRFREQVRKNFRTQAELAEALGVSRPAVIGWLDGKNIPDILSLMKMAELFNVSADYLLGLSETEKPDVSLRAAVEYTGLSEEAAEWLHIGLDDFECDGMELSKREKKQNLTMASNLIKSRYFTRMIQNLGDLSRAAYLEKFMTILDEQHFECDLPEDTPDFNFARKEDREVVISGLIHSLKIDTSIDSTPDDIKIKNDDELLTCVYRALLAYKEESELRQFHAAKEFNKYIDYVINNVQKKAEAQLTQIHTEKIIGCSDNTENRDKEVK